MHRRLWHGRLVPEYVRLFTGCKYDVFMTLGVVEGFGYVVKIVLFVYSLMKNLRSK